METKVFVKPNEQSQACLNSTMARKRAKKWNDLHLRPRVESITDDNVESNCYMIENSPPKGVSFSDLICTFVMSIVGFSFLFLQHQDK